jgi:predicted DNA-binding protein (MmcQ/YjbR family)
MAGLSTKALHDFLAGLPGAALSVQWGDEHVYKIAGKMFAVLRPPSHKATSVTFKASEESFAILTALPGIVPAPYLARAKWVQLDRPGRLPATDLKAYLAKSHKLVAAGLSKKARHEIGLVV